jgi:NAD-dependent deacetylase
MNEQIACCVGVRRRRATLCRGRCVAAGRVDEKSERGLVIVIIGREDENALKQAVRALKAARLPLALTGAGVSVASGIPDFRSRGGLWTEFSPDEYATLEVFYADPVKAWRLYRALGRVLVGRQSNPAHQSLAELEAMRLLHGVITQNVDGLHQQAGSRVVFEMHGEHQHLHCLRCGLLVEMPDGLLDDDQVPRCESCAFPLKPNVVLFGEPVRKLAEIEELINQCDLLLVAGTSAQVYPAAGLVPAVKDNGGVIFEFNREQVLGQHGFGGMSVLTDYFFPGDVAMTLPLLRRAIDRC